MGVWEALRVLAPVTAVMVGVGLMRRDRETAGAALAAAGVAAVTVLALLGTLRPAVGLIAVTGLVGGVIADEKDMRPLALAALAVGMFALIIARFYT